LTIRQKDVPTTVRKLITKEKAHELLDVIKAWGGNAKTQWKSRVDAHKAAIEGGDPFEYAKVAKELSILESHTSLRHHDKTNLEQSLDLLTEEIARTLKKTKKQARKLITEAIEH